MMRFAIRAWAGWSSGPDAVGVKCVPALLRRRVTALGRNTLGTACALPSLDQARYVFSSRHGEFRRTLAILRSIAAAEDLSPTEFSMSVHHALSGLLSISQGNHGGHTAIAAGAESFCFGMMEAAASLAETPSQPVMLIHCDEPLPDEYAVFDTEASAAVLALLLEHTGDEMFSLEMSENLSGGQSQQPAALAFRQFLDGKDAELDFYSEIRRWHWGRHGAG
jgi:hypothetical protein